MGEKKDRVTDALNATKAAVEEGIVPGNVSSNTSPAVSCQNPSVCNDCLKVKKTCRWWCGTSLCIQRVRQVADGQF